MWLINRPINFKKNNRTTHQQTNGCQADVELLRLQTEFSRYIHHHLDTRARHQGQKVRYDKLQALKCDANKTLTRNKTKTTTIMTRGR